MNVGHSIIGFDVADRHRADLLNQAAERRLIAEAHRGRAGRFHGVRHRLGDGLVRFGERLQGAQRRREAEDLAGGALRLAR
jgi:hypothetical protein